MNDVKKLLDDADRQAKVANADESDHPAWMLHELRNAVQAGTASGPGVDADSVFDRLERKYRSALGEP
jgi:hypothetical protein